jgi:hypothetical protein
MRDEHAAYVAMVQGDRTPELVAAWRRVLKDKPTNPPDDGVWR